MGADGVTSINSDDSKPKETELAYSQQNTAADNIRVKYTDTFL